MVFSGRVTHGETDLDLAARRPLYTGRPWFLPGAVAWYRLRDHLDI